MPSRFVNTASDWAQLSTDVVTKAPALTSALKSCDIQSELGIMQNYAFLLDKLAEKSRELLKLREEAARPPAKLLGNDKPLKDLKSDVDKLGKTAIEAGARVKPSAKAMAVKLAKLGDAITKLRQSEQGMPAAGTPAVVALTKFGVAQLKAATAIADYDPVERVAEIKQNPGEANASPA